MVTVGELRRLVEAAEAEIKRAREEAWTSRENRQILDTAERQAL